MNQQNHNVESTLPPPPPPGMGKKNLKVIAMAVICVVLAASLVAVLAIGQNFQTQAANKDTTIKQLQQQISALELQTNVTTVMAQLATLEQNLTPELRQPTAMVASQI